MKTVYFTADTHFGHKNIIKYSNRPFDSVEEMDRELIRRWNEKITPQDVVYHLGDFAFCERERILEIREQLNGEIFLIKGNHDKEAVKCKTAFGWIRDFYELKHPDPNGHNGKHSVTLMHYAMRVWNRSHHGTFHLYGHSHGSLPDDPTSRSFDVGVDCHNYYPISYAEVQEIMAQKEWISPFK